MNAPQPSPKPSWRKPAGILIILVMIAFLAWLVASQAQIIGQWPVLVQAIIYLIVGTIWIAPLRPLMIWMETGKWRE
jgi:hypothetical protein